MEAIHFVGTCSLPHLQVWGSPGTVTIPECWLNKTKKHTHMGASLGSLVMKLRINRTVPWQIPSIGLIKQINAESWLLSNAGECEEEIQKGFVGAGAKSSQAPNPQKQEILATNYGWICMSAKGPECARAARQDTFTIFGGMWGHVREGVSL